MEQALPKREPLVNSTASSRLPTLTTLKTGPKISSRATLISPVTLSRMVGPKKKPSSLGGARRARTTSAPPLPPRAAAGGHPPRPLAPAGVPGGAAPLAMGVPYPGGKLGALLVAGPDLHRRGR